MYIYMLSAGFIYPVLTHWAWSSEGWMNQGFMYDTGDNSTGTITIQYQVLIHVNQEPCTQHKNKTQHKCFYLHIILNFSLSSEF